MLSDYDLKRIFELLRKRKANYAKRKIGIEWE